MNNNGEISFFEDFNKNADIVAFNKEQKATKEEVYLKGRNKLVIKEEFIAYGESKLNDFDLLALLFNENLLNKLKENGINTLFKLNMQSEEDMKKIGISKSNSIKLNALISLCKRGVKKEISEQMNSPKKIYDLCKDLEDKDQEILRLICLNTKNKVIYQEDIFKGGLSSSIAHPREILKAGLKCSAANIIVVHNHPSGDPTPSKEDINFTVRIKEAATIIGIELLDHMVIGKNRYVSLKEKGII